MWVCTQKHGLACKDTFECYDPEDRVVLNLFPGHMHIY